MEITVLNRQRAHRIDRHGLVRFVERLASELPPDGADRMAVCLVSDLRMRELNRRFRGVDRTTDVLSFEGGPDPEGGRHLGDILISVPKARVQAREAGHSLTRELRVLLLHGYLHLLGYDHEKDHGTMNRLQRRLVRSLVDDRRGTGR